VTIVEYSARRRKVRDRYVGPFDEADEHVLRGRMLEVDGEAALVAVRELPRIVALAYGIGQRRMELPIRIALAGQLDLDYVRAVVRQDGGGGPAM